MNQDLIHKLRYSYAGQNEVHSLPLPLEDSLQLISRFFKSNTHNKLCLVFPSKEHASQWLATPITLNEILQDYSSFKEEITESYKRFRTGERLILNNEAVVEWVRIKETEKAGIAKISAVFRTKSTKGSPSLEISIPFEKITKLQRTHRTVLSPQRKVMEALPKRNITCLEQLLQLETFGNQEFIKSRTCLVTKYKSFSESIENVLMNMESLENYFPIGRIDENGATNLNSPLLLANNLSSLALYSIVNPITKILIDGFSAIQERGTDFSDIDVKNIPTILITDLAEIEKFETITNYGFEFFNFTKENLKLEYQAVTSPFHIFENKLRKYSSFNVTKEICQDAELESVTQKIHSIEKDESNSDLTTLKISLIQLTNIISRIAHIPTREEVSVLNAKLNSIETSFLRCRMWLGDSHKPIDASISTLKLVIGKFASKPSEKWDRLKVLINSGQYHYIICATEEEAKALNDSLPTNAHNPRVIAVADVSDELLSAQPQKAILTGWLKSTNINRILSSFLFSELTLLFYQFENKYFNSLQRRNRQYSENIKATIDSNGIRSESQSGFSDLYSGDDSVQTTYDSSFDILEFELRIDNSQYSKYLVDDKNQESIKAKRVNFQTDEFLYSTETHRFLVIKKIGERRKGLLNLQKKTLDELKSGDIIVLINTSTDILADLIERTTNRAELQQVKEWANLWKVLLRDYFEFKIHKDFGRLVSELSAQGCKKHRLTIRNWLNDPLIIGPEDDSDLLSIAVVTNSKTLFDNISKVRDSISTMTGWRMKASDYFAGQIKAQIHDFADNSTINRKTAIEGLGNLNILKVVEISNDWDNIDARYVNRLLQKENI